MIGSTAGTLLCGIKSGYLGRKKTVLVTQAVSFVGALCIVFAKTVAVFCIGNFLAGYTNGLFMGVAPIYTGEINQPFNLLLAPADSYIKVKLSYFCPQFIE